MKKDATKILNEVSMKDSYALGKSLVNNKISLSDYSLLDLASMYIKLKGEQEMFSAACSSIKFYLESSEVYKDVFSTDEAVCIVNGDKSVTLTCSTKTDYIIDDTKLSVSTIDKRYVSEKVNLTAIKKDFVRGSLPSPMYDAIKKETRDVITVGTIKEYKPTPEPSVAEVSE